MSILWALFSYDPHSPLDLARGFSKQAGRLDTEDWLQEDGVGWAGSHIGHSGELLAGQQEDQEAEEEEQVVWVE